MHVSTLNTSKPVFLISQKVMIKRTRPYINNDSAEDLSSIGKSLKRMPTRHLGGSKGRTGKRSPRIKAQYDSAADLTQIGLNNWDAQTKRCVALSTLPLLLLLAPQLWMNYVNLTTNNAAALAALSWMVCD